jgi:hypothetical protein
MIFRGAAGCLGLNSGLYLVYAMTSYFVNTLPHTLIGCLSAGKIAGSPESPPVNKLRIRPLKKEWG